MIIKTAGAEIFVQEAGSGTPLLLIHGLGMSSELWCNQVPVFATRYRTVAVDLRGFGQSSKPSEPGAYAIQRLAADMAAVIDRLELEPCHVLGTSMGGFVAQALAISRPELCRSLMLCHTAPRMAIPADVLASRVEALGRMSLREYASIVVEQALAPQASDATKAWVADMVANNDKRAYTQVLTEGLSSFDASARLGEISVPTLVITGSLDRVLPPAGGQELARLIPGARLVEIEGVGHIGYGEDPQAFNAAVMGFLVGL
jgi:pimeloyl-ACP methyl ester carboxylesterase